MADTGELKVVGDTRMDPGRPFVSNIALDDFVYDVNANSWDECQFMGNVYQLPVEDLKESGDYEIDADDKLEPSERRQSDDRLENLSVNEEANSYDLEPMADVIDIWVPRDGMIYTFLVDSTDNLQLSGKEIASMKWEGSRKGPYKPMISTK